MKLCSYGHEKVSFEGRSCPVCEMERDKNKKIEILEEQISELKNIIGDLESKSE